MTAPAAAAMGRRLAESLMTSTCTVYRPGEPTTDPSSGEVTASRSPVWSGPCRVRPAGLLSGKAEAGGAEVVATGYLVSLPYAAAGIEPHDHLTIDTSPDPELVTTDLRIREVAKGDQITARRLLCEEID